MRLVDIREWSEKGGFADITIARNIIFEEFCCLGILLFLCYGISIRFLIWSAYVLVVLV